MASRVHPTAIVDAGALLDEADVGPYCVIEGATRIGRGTRLLAHVVVHSGTALGDGNTVHPFAVLGSAPQAKKAHAGQFLTEIGARNVIREHVTIHGGTDGRTTRVGSDNLLMVGAHVAHDVVVGSHCVVANAVQLAGHARVGDWVTFGGLSGLAQHVSVGESAFVAAGAMCERDVPPFMIVQGDRARVRSVNVVGLRRRGVPEESIAKLTGAFRTIFTSGTPRSVALSAIAAIARDDVYVAALVEALSR